nr:unnamed protein product [Callosobruchus chinensis]
MYYAEATPNTIFLHKLSWQQIDRVALEASMKIGSLPNEIKLDLTSGRENMASFPEWRMDDKIKIPGRRAHTVCIREEKEGRKAIPGNLGQCADQQSDHCRGESYERIFKFQFENEMDFATARWTALEIDSQML